MASEVHIRLLDYQKRLLKSTNPFTFAVCGRGSGKTYTMSVISLMKLLQGENLILCAQRYDSLRDVLMRQVQMRAKEWGLENVVKFSKNPIRATYGDWTMYGSSYECLDGARGLDDINTILLDEVALAPLDVLDVLGPCLRGPHVTNPSIRGATTPRSTSLWNHRFAGMMEGSKDWEIIKARTYDNWTLTKRQLEIIERSIQSEEMRLQELEAQIRLNGSNNCIINADEFPSYYMPNGDRRVIAGLDLSKGTVERDAFGWFVRRGNEILDMQEFRGMSHEGVVKYIMDFHKRCPIDKLNMDSAFSEYAYNILKYYIPCEQVAFSSRAPEGEEKEYANMRAWIWFSLAWTVKHGLHLGWRPSTTLYDADGRIIGEEVMAHLRQQMCTCTWHRDRQGRLLIIDKEEWRKLIGMSPDIGDAAALTCIDRWSDDPVMKDSSVSTVGVSEEEEADIMSEYA